MSWAQRTLTPTNIPLMNSKHSKTIPLYTEILIVVVQAKPLQAREGLQRRREGRRAFGSDSVVAQVKPR